MKRILIFSLAYHPLIGGAEIAIKELTDRLGRDFSFDLVTLRFDPKHPRTEKIGNVTVHRIGFGGRYISKILFVPLAALKGRTLHRHESFDAAWAVMTYMLFPVVLMRMLGIRLPYILNLQDGDPFERVFKRWFILPVRPLLVYGFRHATIIQTLSNYLANWARKVGYHGPIEVIPNGADTKRFAEAIPKDVGRKDSEVWLVTSSRLVHKNAVDDVIRALALLPTHIKFLVLGVGPDERVLKALAKELGVEERVQFRGHVSHAELPGYLRGSDIFVRPSRTEGFGASFPEAMAAGLPVIATQEGGIADFLFDKKHNPDKPATGFIVPKDSPDEVATAVKEVLVSPEETKQVVENARKLVTEKYDWDIIARNMKERVFKKLA